MNKEISLTGYKLTHVGELTPVKGDSKRKFATIVAKKMGMRGVSRNVWFNTEKPHLDRFTYEELQGAIGQSISDWGHIEAHDIERQPVMIDGKQAKTESGDLIFRYDATILVFEDETTRKALWSGYRATLRGETRTAEGYGAKESDSKDDFNANKGDDMTDAVDKKETEEVEA